MSTVRLLVAACRAAGVDPDAVFQHLDREDVAAYDRAIAAGEVLVEHLPPHAQAHLDAAAADRCSCSRCRARRAG